MYSFLLSILALILGYIVYGAFVDRMFGPDPNRPTPALTKADGVDFIRAFLAGVHGAVPQHCGHGAHLRRHHGR